MASTHYFSVTDLIWLYDTENPTDPDPAPGEVTAETGENSVTVEITEAGGTRTVKHVGAQQPDSVRWIELRDRDAGEL